MACLWHVQALGENIRFLQNKKQALIHERNLVKTAPGDFYLIIDLPSQKIDLKADGNLLRSCPILDQSSFKGIKTHPYKFVARIDPVTVEPGNRGLRHRGRLLPLDFAGRLLEGPRQHSRLYFKPDLILQGPKVPPSKTPHLILAPDDIKALGSALRITQTAILIPQQETSP